MSVIAAYFGRCNSCGEGIEPGEVIDRDEDDGWSHEECSGVGATPMRPTVTCPECFIIKPCECDA